MADLPVWVFRVQMPDGWRDLVACVAPERASSRGLVPQAIVGELIRPLDPGEPIRPEVFARNSVFVDFLHEVIGRRGPDCPELRSKARQVGNGSLFLVDRRTPTPQGDVPAEDIIGAFEVRDGEFVPDSYQGSPNHMILSDHGFLDLGTQLQAALLEEVQACD